MTELSKIRDVVEIFQSAIAGFTDHTKDGLNNIQTDTMAELHTLQVFLFCC